MQRLTYQKQLVRHPDLWPRDKVTLYVHCELDPWQPPLLLWCNWCSAPACWVVTRKTLGNWIHHTGNCPHVDLCGCDSTLIHWVSTDKDEDEHSSEEDEGSSEEDEGSSNDDMMNENDR